MYENLKKAINEKYTKEWEEKIFYINNGYSKEWSEDKQNTDRGIEQYSTKTRWYQYKAGEITREKAIELAIARALKEVDKDEAEEMQKIEAVSKAREMDYINISVEWHKSRTWGSCPRVEVRTNDGYFTGSASGCGYNKESAAVAQALNQSASVLKALYEVKEQSIEKNSHDVLGYGSGYGIRPYFEGGVGISCFRSIFERLGYKWETTASGKTFDAYRVSK